MRQSFIRTLIELAEKDKRILLLTADIGYMALEPFAEKFPDRFFNVGVAEQNMVGISTGLAEAGFIPFIYSIATFVSLRPYEFIRNGPIMHRLPVRIVGIGGGFEYGYNGLTHHAIEDIAVMRAQPGITIISPADYQQARTSLLATWDVPGPVYYRLGKDDKTVVPGLNGRYKKGVVYQILKGKDLLIISTGSIAKEVFDAANILYKKGLECTVAIVADINPAPVSALFALISKFKMVMTVEAHYITGALGSLVAEIIAEHGLPCRLMRCGAKILPETTSGSQEYLYHLHGIDCISIVETALSLFNAANTEKKGKKYYDESGKKK